jgi:sugar lactone lactonase YvrE
MHKIKLSTVFALLAVVLLILPVSASAANFPEIIPLPTGFRPEGIAVGRGSTFYTGSLADGAIYSGDLRTGEGSLLAAGQPGMVSVGMAYDHRSGALFVAGGGTGLARVFDASSGALLAAYTLADPGIFINDVIVTRDAAYFTNSNEAVFYRLPLGPAGALPEDVEEIALTGDWQQVGGFNANGIEATPDGKWLIIVNSTVGALYRVDPTTGWATQIDLQGESVSAGDGLLFRDGLLYVVRNQLNQIVVVELADDLASGVVIDRLTSPNFNVPTTIAAFGDALYAVNAKFGAPNPGAIPYEIVRVPLP